MLKYFMFMFVPSFINNHYKFINVINNLLKCMFTAVVSQYNFEFIKKSLVQHFRTLLNSKMSNNIFLYQHQYFPTEWHLHTLHSLHICVLYVTSIRFVMANEMFSHRNHC